MLIEFLIEGGDEAEGEDGRRRGADGGAGVKYGMKGILRTVRKIEVSELPCDDDDETHQLHFIDGAAGRAVNCS